MLHWFCSFAVVDFDVCYLLVWINFGELVLWDIGYQCFNMFICVIWNNLKTYLQFVCSNSDELFNVLEVKENLHIFGLVQGFDMCLAGFSILVNIHIFGFFLTIIWSLMIIIIIIIILIMLLWGYSCIKMKSFDISVLVKQLDFMWYEGKWIP
jgi:hypothetical protein